MSSAIVYLGVGYGLGPGGLGVITPDPVRYVDLLRPVAEAAVLISLFTVGLKMGVPLLDRRWLLPVRLASMSMAITVALIAAVGVWGLNMPLGAAVLLGAILAPTDPVLASGVQMQPGPKPDQVRFSLAGEGGLNDGTAFPFVMLALGLLGLHDLGGGGWRWWVLDLLWATLGGLFIGGALGALIGWMVVRLRTRQGGTAGWDEFLSLGLVACAYGAAQLSQASGFLGVFAAGLALQRVKEQPRTGTSALDVQSRTLEARTDWATHSHHASLAMTRAVQGFNEQLEKVAELGIVVIVGAMLPYIAPSLALWWFIPLLLVVVRPLAVLPSTAGERLSADQRLLVGWFGIRGIGSVFYLLFAIQSGVSGALAQELATLTLGTVAASILVHGVSVQPLMRRYGVGKSQLR
ncbi:MAG TPA: cation:proton antiporter [Burkholderiales bacterium]|nr:cation:proton antiporter [Burkholderiales bacterium]